MSWRDILAANTGSTQRAYHELFDERIASLTKVCTSLSSSVDEIRSAQSGIAELQRLKNVPEMLKREAHARGG